jgi:hypothetical protein
VSRGAAQRPVLRVIKPKKAGASSVAKTHWYLIKGCRVDQLAVTHTLIMELDLQSLFILCSCTYWLTPRNSTLPPHLGSYTRALLVSQDRRSLCTNPLLLLYWWHGMDCECAGDFGGKIGYAKLHALPEFCQMLRLLTFEH